MTKRIALVALILSGCGGGGNLTIINNIQSDSDTIQSEVTQDAQPTQQEVSDAQVGGDTQTTPTTIQDTQVQDSGTQQVSETQVSETQVPDTQVPDTQVPDTAVPDTQLTVPDTQLTVPDTQLTVPDTQVTVADTQVTVADTQVTVPDTQVTLSCSYPVANCDNNAQNGCEVNLTSDRNNCGVCGNTCADQANSTGSCGSGSCSVQCKTGFGNCNTIKTDGCEINLNTDSNNCGGCGKKCGGSETCQSGACTAIQCSTGTANCDNNAQNGCETPTTTLTNCGGCGISCTAPANMVASCNGSCQFTCKAGFADCNGNQADGCEVNLNTDTNHCGTCSTTCSSTGGTASCNSGSCGISCSTTNANCDGATSNGCETIVTNDINNCGGCNIKCTLAPNTVSTTCSNNSCGVGACTPGYADCNGNKADGCELSTTNDVNNCGGCGIKCIGGGTCSSGTCQYPVTEVAAVPTGGILDITDDASNVYWVTIQGVYKVAKIGGAITKIASVTQPGGITTDYQGNVYWAEQLYPQKLMKVTSGNVVSTVWTYTGSALNIPVSKYFAQHMNIKVVADKKKVIDFLSQEYQTCTPIGTPISFMISVNIDDNTSNVKGTMYNGVSGNYTQPLTLAKNTTMSISVGNPMQTWVSDCGPITSTYTPVYKQSFNNGFVYADGYQQLAGIRNIALGLGNTFVTATIPNNIYSSFGASWYITGGIQANMLPISTPSNITAVTCTDPIILQSGSSVKDYCFIGDAVGNVSDLLAYDNSSTNRPYTTKAIGQGYINHIITDDVSMFWVNTDTQGQHIRKAVH